MAEDKGEEKKKYQVVDRRHNYDEEAPAEPEPAQEPAEASADEAELEEQFDEAGEEPRRELRIEDAMRLALSAVREQALFALGLLISKQRRAEPDMDRAMKVSKIFSQLADKFSANLEDAGLMESDRPEPSLDEIAAFCFNLLQGQVFVYMGLIANPATGLISKDLAQAKLGIDFCTALLEAVRPELNPNVAKQIEGALADMQINFVQQKI